jgi:4-hydroxy-2-oxoheptanedioate aldolase
LGRRPVDGGNADGAYCSIEFVEYLRQANERRFIVLQIEDPEPLEYLDEIAAVEGYDVLFYGPGDFSHSIGVPGQWEHPQVLETRKRVCEAALKHGKIAGTVSSLAGAAEIVGMGYRFVNIASDVTALMNYCTDTLDQWRAIVAE